MGDFEHDYCDSFDDDEDDSTEDELIEGLRDGFAIEEYRRDKPWLEAEAVLRYHEVMYGPHSDEYLRKIWDWVSHPYAEEPEPDPPEPPADA